MPEFNQTIKNDDSGINESDQKIDTTAQTDEEKKAQEDVLLEINNFNTDETSIGESESEDQKSDDEDEKSETDKESEEEPDKTGEEGEEELESKEDKSEDTKPEWEQEGFISQEAYATYQAKHQPTKLESENKADLSEAEKQKDSIFRLCDKYSEILPKTVKENYQKFYDSGNNAFLHLDTHLHKFSVALEKTNDKLPFEERIEMAFNLAFSKEIAKQEQKKGEIKAEVRTQKVNKAVSNPTKTNDGKSTTQYTPEQQKMAERMGVKLS